MAVISKTMDVVVLALQQVAGLGVVISSEFDLSSKFGGALYIRVGRRTNASGVAGINLRWETSPKAAGAGFWVPYPLTTTDFLAAESEAITGTQNPGAQTLTVASTTNLAIGQQIFIDDTGTPANSEFHRIKSLVTNTSITLEEPIVNAATGKTLYNRAELYKFNLDFMADKRARLVVDGAPFTQAFAVQAMLVTADVIG